MPTAYATKDFKIKMDLQASMRLIMLEGQRVTHERDYYQNRLDIYCDEMTRKFESLNQIYDLPSDPNVKHLETLIHQNNIVLDDLRARYRRCKALIDVT
jgi:hypothetical protein